MTNSRRGFTLVELVLGIAVTAIIFIAASSAYVFLIKTGSRFSQTQVLDNAKVDLSQELLSAIRWAGSVTCSSSLVIDGTTYAIGPTGLLSKNGQPLTARSVQATSFSCANYSSFPGYASLQLTINLQDVSVTPARSAVLNLVASQRRTSYTHADQ